MVSQFTDNAEAMFRLPHSLAVLLVKVASHVSERKAGYRFEDASCVKALRHATIPMMFIHGGADTFVNPKYLDINYNACASIDREAADSRRRPHDERQHRSGPLLASR